MKILTIGDVVGEAGIDALHALLRRIKRDTGADFVIVNGENAAGNGVLPRQAEDIFDAGADVGTQLRPLYHRNLLAAVWGWLRPRFPRITVRGSGAKEDNRLSGTHPALRIRPKNRIITI